MLNIGASVQQSGAATTISSVRLQDRSVAVSVMDVPAGMPVMAFAPTVPTAGLTLNVALADKTKFTEYVPSGAHSPRALTDTSSSGQDMPQSSGLVAVSVMAHAP